MKKIVVVLLMLLLSGCDVPRNSTYEGTINRPISYTGINVLDEKAGFGGNWIIEQSIINNGSYLEVFYGDLGDNGIFKYSKFHNDNTIGGALIGTQIGGRNVAFPYTILHEGVYYTAYGNSAADKIYLMKSTNKIDWEYLNSGDPIIIRDIDDWHYMWNPAIIISGNVMHMYVETADTGGQNNVGLSYATVDMTTMAVNKTNHILPTGGNPYIGYMNDKLTLIYGTTETGHWRIRASEVTNWTTLTQLDFVVEQAGVHICDPHLVETTTGVYLLSYSYDQRYTVFTYFD